MTGGEEVGIEVRRLNTEDRPWAREVVTAHWGSTVSVSRGRAIQTDLLAGFVAVADDARCGLLTYDVRGDEFEIVTLNALEPGRGVGTALLAAAVDEARRAACRRVWLVTTNDNEPAIRFYERRGFSIVKVHRDAIAAYRRIKPEIPDRGVGGVPIRDEIEMVHACPGAIGARTGPTREGRS